jgi:thymidylate kinase
MLLPKVIYFFGPDGSGKTTLATKTVETLSKNGFKVRKGWMRGTHTVSYAFARLLRLHGAFRGQNHFMVSIPKNLTRLWRFLEFTSALPVFFYRFALPKLFGFYVVGERYLPDYLVWVSIVLNDDNFAQAPESKFLLSLTKKTGAGFYITADTTILSKRSFENPAFLTRQQAIYANLATALGAFKIDTTHTSAEEAFQKIYTTLTQQHLLNP